MQYHYTYLITQQNTGEFYIGVRSCKIEPDKDKYMGSPCTWKRMPTYDLSKQTKIVLSIYDSRQEANKNEKILIDKFKNDPLNRNYHNNENFNTYGVTKSEEHKQKLSKAVKGVKFQTEESKRRIGISQKGEKNINFDSTIYNFIHKNGAEISCTRNELYTTYNLDPSNMDKVIKGKRNHHKGWKLKC